MTESFPIYWIAVVPLLAGAVILVSADRMHRRFAWPFSVSSLCVSLLVFIWVFFKKLIPLLREWEGLSEVIKIYRSPHPRVVGSLGNWFEVGSFEVSLGFQIDALGGVAVAAALIAALSIAVYFRGLNWVQRIWVRQLGAVTFTAGAVLVFLLADNLGLAFAAWILAGTGGAVLVGTGTQESHAPEAARSSWLISRLGDVLLLLALLVALAYGRSLAYEDLRRASWIMSHPDNRWFWNLKPGFVFTGLLAGAALCRSAQFPFHFWLSQGSRGTVGATAALLGLVAPMGVYLVLRLNFIVARSPVPLVVMGCVAGLSSLLLALASSAQHTIRKSVGYLVSAQIGAALAVVGFGGYSTGVFHLVVMSLAGVGMALACGSVERGNEGVSDLRELGGLLGFMPRTGSAFLLTGVTMAGLWPLAGGRSTVYVLEQTLVNIARQTPGITRLQPDPAAILSWIMFVVLCGTVAVTGFSSMRLFFRIFTGKRLVRKASLEESDDIKQVDHCSGEKIADGGFLLWLVPMALGVTAACWGLLWSMTGYRGDAGGWVEASGIPSLSRFLNSSFPTRALWTLRDGFTAVSPPDGIGAGGGVHIMMNLAVALTVIAACGAAGLFFKGETNPLGGRLISSPRYRWFYNIIHRDLGAGFTVRVWSERLLPVLGWIQRGLGERVVTDFLLTRLPVSIVRLTGWLSARIQRWKTRSLIAVSVIALALLAALAARPGSGIEAVPKGDRVLLRVSGIPSWGANLPWEARWDLNGDGKWDMQGLEIEHGFPGPGRYEIQVEVRDLRWNKRYRLKETIEVGGHVGSLQKSRGRVEPNKAGGLR